MYDQITLDGSTRQQKLYDYSIEILKIAEPPEGYYLCTSFGKDSIAAQRLCDEAGVKYDAHHNITGIDPPELVYFGRKYYPDVQRHMYPRIKLGDRMVPGSMWRLIEKKGMLPMRNKRYCCEVLKEDGGAGRRCVMGVRASESDRRKKSWAPISDRGIKKKDRGTQLRLFDTIEMYRMFEPDDISQSVQQCANRGKITVSPLYYWTDTDLWDFIHDRKMPYCQLYDEGHTRLGCIGCPMVRERHRREQFKRWPEFYTAYSHTLQRLIDSGKRHSERYPTAEAVMEWWLSDRTQEKPIEGQIGIDEIWGGLIC